MNKKIRAIGAAVLVVIWLVLTGFAWFGPAKAESESERRPLDQWPGIKLEEILDGKFMTKFEDYTLDQFPLRDRFRQIKSLFHYYAMRRGDNNDIYIADGYAAKMEYPLNESRIKASTKIFTQIYEQYLKDAGCTSFVAVVPDKGYYLAEENGYLAMDYEKLFATVQEGMPWASYIDLTQSLSIEDYYYTDTHWRQEKILETAGVLAQALGVTAPKAENYTQEKLDRPFYGVYYGQAALPMEPEDMYIMRSELLSACQVWDVEANAYTDVYNMDKLTAKDPYDVFLSGARAVLRIENPNAKTDRELIVFRDSFSSSMIPLLVEDYATVTLVDIRYVPARMLDQYVTFDGQDVLFMYSTLVLNSVVFRQ